MPSAVGKPASKNLTSDKALMIENETDRNGVGAEGERASRKRIGKGGGTQDVLKLIDVARAAGVKEIAKLRALAKEYTERADAIERKLGSMIEVEPLSKAVGSEADVSSTTVAGPAKRERVAKEESATASASIETSSRSTRATHDVKSALERVVDLLKDQPEGLRADEICTALGLRTKEMAGILKEGLDGHRFHSRGEKRATLYFAK
jgi:hypothetical protein